MKKLAYTILLSGLVSAAVAQQTKTHQDMHSSIHDNGKTMTVEFNGTSGGKYISYVNTFKVNGMSQADKDALLKRLADSIGVNYTTQPRTLSLPGTPKPPVASSHTSSHTSAFHADVDDNGSTLRLAYQGINDKNKQVDYTHTFDVKGMSKPQKAALIRRVTDSLGLTSQVNAK